MKKMKEERSPRGVHEIQIHSRITSCLLAFDTKQIIFLLLGTVLAEIIEDGCTGSGPGSGPTMASLHCYYSR